MTIDTSNWPLNTIEIETRTPGHFRAVTICDPHFSAHNPPVYKQDYWPIVLDTMLKIFKFAHEKECDAILWAGDIFHLKTAIRNPLWFLTEVIGLFRDASEKGILHLGIAGNHDVKYGSLAEGLEGQPLHVLATAGCYNLLDKNEYLFEIRNEDVLDTKKTTKVRVAGASFLHGSAKPLLAKKKQGADYLVTLGHFWFGSQSGEFFGEVIYGPDYLDAGETDVYVIGHHHEDQGIQEVGKKVYFAHGSPSRTGAHKHDLERRPAAGFLDISAAGIEHSILRPKMPEIADVMDLETRKVVMAEKEKIEEFVKLFSESGMDAGDPRKILDSIDPNMDAQLKSRVLDYLDAAEAEA